MSLLTLVQGVCRRIGLQVPSVVYTSTDQQILQLMEIANEEGQSLAERYPWQALINEATHTSLAAESQGAITSIATNGFKYILNNTIWNRTEQRPIYGALTPAEWQMLKASSVTGPFEQLGSGAGHSESTPRPRPGRRGPSSMCPKTG